MDVTNMRCLAKTNDICAEGCVWHPQLNAVFWTDINRGLLHCCWLTSSEVETWQFDQPVTAVVLTTQERLIALVLGGCIVTWDTQLRQIVDVLYRLPEWPRLRCNDARVDPAGVLWFGTMQNNVRSDGKTAEVTEWAGALYSIIPGEEAKQWCSGFGISNTLAWSPDGGAMYFGDTLKNCIYRGAFDPVRSSLEHHEVFFVGFDRGLPDGSAVDAEGHLWNCRYGGGCIVRVAPDGSIASVFDTAARNPTTCAFGGENLKTMFFTSAASMESHIEGSLFSFEALVPGLPSTRLRL